MPSNSEELPWGFEVEDDQEAVEPVVEKTKKRNEPYRQLPTAPLQGANPAAIGEKLHSMRATIVAMTDDGEREHQRWLDAMADVLKSAQ